MLFDSGIVYLCNLENTAEKGMMPQMRLVPFKRLLFSERTVGFTRQYEAMGANAQIDLLIRTHFVPEARIGMFAVLGNGSQYRVTNAAMIYDNSLRVTELSLSRLEDYYEVDDEIS